MRFLREWVLNNWSLKLLALAISFLLWTTYTAEPFSEVGYLVPLEFRNVPVDLEISGDVPTQVHLRLRGRSGLLRRFTPKDLSIAVDLSGYPAGETQIRLTAEQVTVPYGATVVDIAPAEIRVPLVPRHAHASGSR
jgi:YbbR domain-containing protein